MDGELDPLLKLPACFHYCVPNSTSAANFRSVWTRTRLLKTEPWTRQRHGPTWSAIGNTVPLFTDFLSLITHTAAITFKKRSFQGHFDLQNFGLLKRRSYNNVAEMG